MNAEPDSSKPSTDVRPERPDAPQRLGGRAAYAFAPGSRVLSGYVIKRGLGQGGFGEVYYAVSDAGKDVALKLVRRNLEVELRGVMQCLNVKHPNLIGLYDVKVDDQENHWIVMEYVAGERLTDIIERAPQGLPPAEAIKILSGIAAGVGYLHEAGIVHRDLKPANIFVENGFIKIGDYGLSKFISSSRRSGQTESVGTVHYMAPEIANGRYGKQIDIYALGVLFCELLTGKLPFDGESVGEILMKHLTAEPDLATVPEPYRAAIASALKKDPEQRPRTVAAFLNAIDPGGERGDLVGAEGPIGLNRAAATNRTSHGEHGAIPAANNAQAPRGFFAELLANLVPRGSTAKSMVLVGIAMIFGVAIAGAMMPFVFLALWVWLIVAVVRTLRGDAKQARTAFREARGLDLRPTEAHVDAARPKTFGRRVAMAVGLLVVSALFFGSIARHRTVERRVDVPAGSQVTITGTTGRSSSVTSVSRGEHVHVVEAVPAPYAVRKIGLIGLVSVVAIGAVVGLSIAVGRKARSKIDEHHALRLAALESAPVPANLRGLAIDFTGSILLMFGASIVINRLLLLLLVDQLGATTYLWTTATTFTAVVLTSFAIKAVRYIDRESSGRRLMFFAVGAAVGATSWGFAEYLGYSIPYGDRLMGMRMGVRTTSWPECYVDGVPTVLAYVGYYGLSFLAIDWWNMTIPKRGSRWRIGDAFVAVFWAGAVHFVFPFPQPWGVLTAAGTALVLPFAFPLPPPKPRARAAQKVGGIRA